MFDITTKVHERVVAFDNIKTDSKWNLKYTGSNVERTIDIKIHVTLDRNGILRIHGEAWDSYDKILFGQICEALLHTNLKYSAKFIELAVIWMLYHMNDKQLGNPAQIETLRKAVQNNEISIIDLHNQETCKACLERHGMLVYNGHTYGQSAIHNPVPPEILSKFKF